MLHAVRVELWDVALQGDDAERVLNLGEHLQLENALGVQFDAFSAVYIRISVTDFFVPKTFGIVPMETLQISFGHGKLCLKSLNTKFEKDCI